MRVRLKISEKKGVSDKHLAFPTRVALGCCAPGWQHRFARGGWPLWLLCTMMATPLCMVQRSGARENDAKRIRGQPMTSMHAHTHKRTPFVSAMGPAGSCLCRASRYRPREPPFESVMGPTGPRLCRPWAQRAPVCVGPLVTGPGNPRLSRSWAQRAPVCVGHGPSGLLFVSGLSLRDPGTPV